MPGMTLCCWDWTGAVDYKGRPRFSMNRRAVLAFVSAMFLGAITATAGPSFQGLGELAGGSFNNLAFGTSADGTVIVGRGTSASGFEAFRWTLGGGVVGVGRLACGVFRV